MASEDTRARQALGETVQTLVERYGGVRSVARRLGKESTYASQVSRWQRGLDVTLGSLSLLAAKLDTEITVTFRPDRSIEATEKAPPPEWARELERKLDVLVARAGVDPDALNDDETTRLVREALARAASLQQSGGGA